MTAPRHIIASARSLLFVPGDRPDRFAKAGAAGPDLVCIDLEDAVAPSARPQARAAIQEFLAQQTGHHRYGVRINRWTSADGLRDVLHFAGSLQDAGPASARPAFESPAFASPAFVMLSKTENAVQVQMLATHLPGVPVIALIESAAGLLAAAEIAKAHPQLQALMLGAADLVAEVGCEMAWEPLLHARCALVLAAAASGLAAIDVPWLDVSNAEGAKLETQRAAALGFSAKAAIHPLQITPIHAGLRPTEMALRLAQRVVDAAQRAEQAGSAAVLLDGRLVDRPVLLAAQRTLRRAGEWV
jgi:(S)-citramalyl-CoA lyase